MDGGFFARENCKLALAKGSDSRVKSMKNRRRNPVLRSVERGLEKGMQEGKRMVI